MPGTALRYTQVLVCSSNKCPPTYAEIKIVGHHIVWVYILSFILECFFSVFVHMCDH